MQKAPCFHVGNLGYSRLCECVYGWTHFLSQYYSGLLSVQEGGWVTLRLVVISLWPGRGDGTGVWRGLGIIDTDAYFHNRFGPLSKVTPSARKSSVNSPRINWCPALGYSALESSTEESIGPLWTRWVTAHIQRCSSATLHASGTDLYWLVFSLMLAIFRITFTEV